MLGLIRKNIYYILLVLIIVCLFTVNSLKLHNLDDYSLFFLGVDYSGGFRPRGLFGTLTRNINFKYIIMFFRILVFVLYLFYIKLIRKIDKNDKLGIFYSTLLFSAPIYFWEFTEFRLEILFLPILIILFYLYKSSISNYIKVFILFVLSIISMLIYHAFIFLAAPLICVFLLYRKHYRVFFIYSIYLIVVFLIINSLTYNNSKEFFDSLLIRLFDRGFNNYILDSKGLYHSLVFDYRGLYHSLVLDGSKRDTFCFNDFSMYAIIGYALKTFVIIFLNLLNILLLVYYWVKVNIPKVKKIMYLSVLTIPFILMCLFNTDFPRFYYSYMINLHIFTYILISDNIDVNIDFSLYSVDKLKCLRLINLLFTLICSSLLLSGYIDIITIF